MVSLIRKVEAAHERKRRAIRFKNPDTQEKRRIYESSYLRKKARLDADPVEKERLRGNKRRSVIEREEPGLMLILKLGIYSGCEGYNCERKESGYKESKIGSLEEKPQNKMINGSLLLWYSFSYAVWSLAGFYLE